MKHTAKPEKGPSVEYFTSRTARLGRRDTDMSSYTASVRLATSAQWYMALTRSCSCWGTMRRLMETASTSARQSASASGSANFIMLGGSTSGTPPTLVDTTNSPHDAASSSAMQKASVREQFRNICPLTNTSLTSWCGTAPSSSILSCSRHLSRISSSSSFLGPSPPMMKCTFVTLAHTSGMTFTSRSTPFRYTSLLSSTMFTVFCGLRREGSGANLVVSTALGMAETRVGCTAARRTRFSLQVWDTQITWSTSERVAVRALLMWMEARSAKPKREWSV
mmetsp:Transcript_4398/g.9892  ORF Transcript_4398/g.9892 Transcript_4398/m.9892 type:complete len:279 (+) Transcript_4398:3-839(+)